MAGSGGTMVGLGVRGRVGGPAVVHVGVVEAERLWSVATRRQVGTSAAADQVEVATLVAGALPEPVVLALHRFRERGTPSNTLLLRGLLPGHAEDRLPPTPPVLFGLPDSPAVRRYGLVLLAAMTRIGSPFTFATLHEGRLVQNVAPVAGQEGTQTSGGSESELGWHVEDAFSDERCDHVGLLCLRGAPDAATRSATVRARDLDPAAVRVLRQPRFGVVPDSAHGTTAAPTPITVLEGPDDDLELRADAIYLAPLRRPGPGGGSGAGSPVPAARGGCADARAPVR